MIAPDVGGGFGSKIFIYNEETVCAWAAKKINRPVKWTAERTESFLTDAHGRDHVTHAELALDADGKILAMRVHTIANLGAYPSTFWSCVPTYLYATLLSGQYTFQQSTRRSTRSIRTLSPVDAVRGAGRPEATFVVERIVETAARETGRDPAEFRRRNFVDDNSRIRRRLSFAYDAGDYGEGARQGAGAGRLQGLRARARRPRPPRASCAGSDSPPISKPAALRHRQAAGALGARRRPMGISRKCASIRQERSKS